MRLKLGAIENKRLLIPAIALVLVAGGGITRALLGGTSSPVSSSDIELQRGLIGWWKLNGNARDYTPYSRNGTITGSPTSVADREGTANSAYSFSGTGQYISIPNFDNTVLTQGQEGASWSLSVWATGGGQNGILFGKLGWNGGILQSSSNYTFSIYSSSDIGFTISKTASTSQWNLLTAVYNAGTMYFYVNGQLVGSKAAPTTMYPYSSTLGIGSGGSNSWLTNATLSDARVYNRAISAAEVSALYKEYNPSLNIDSSQNSLVGWWKFDGNAKDSSPYANNGTLSGTTFTSDRESLTNRAISFNGSTDSMVVADNSGLHVSPNLTLSVWLKVDSLTNKTGCCAAAIAKEASATNRNFNIYVNRTSGYVVGSSSFGGTQFDLSSNTNIFDGKWHLVTYVVSGTSQQIYVDGTFKNSHTTAANVDTPSNNIGFSTSGAFQGEMDDARLYSRAMSASEISTLYKSYDSQISLYQNSSGGINLGSGLLGEWDFNGNAKDSTPYANNGTVNGATLTADREGRANSAYLLGDSSAWINVGSPSTYSNLSSGLTYNIWLMRTTSSVAHWPEIMGASNTHIYYGIRSQNFGDSIDFEYATSPYAGSTFSGTVVQSLPVNQWHMFTVTYDGSTLKTYWDSSLKTTASSVALNPAFGGLQFTASTSGFAGSVDDARVWGRALSQTEVTALYSQYR